MSLAPALITCTSSEYLGQRPLRRILRDRSVVVILGESGTGKTSVARRIAEDGPGPEVVLDACGLHDELVARARNDAWSPRIAGAGTLVLDGPVFVRTRPAVAKFLKELFDLRIAAGLRTVVCALPQDASLEPVLAGVPVGARVTIGLRFPNSRSGRMRFARRVCDGLGLERSAARGTDLLEPWGYQSVTQELRRRLRQSLSAPSAGAEPALHR